jgi:hypothetical protein
MTQLQECNCSNAVFYDQVHTITEGETRLVGGSTINCRTEYVVQPVEE